jgi:hypothetical protein
MATEPLRFTIPDRELPDMRLLAHAGIADLEALDKALTEEKPTVDLESFCTSIAGRASLPAEVVSPLVSMLWRLAYVQRTLERPTESFLETLTGSLEDKGADQWTQQDRSSWSERRAIVASLLASDRAIAVSAKAGELLHEQQLNFCTARILTDVRPLYDEAAQQIQGFMPFHTLAITYHESGETRETHINMDAKDLTRLRAQLERAEQKEKLLRQNLAESNWMVI